MYSSVSHRVQTQCLRRLGFLAKKKNSWIFDISCQDLGNYCWQGSQDFSRSWKEVQENFWNSWQENQEYPRSWQETQESLASKLYKIYRYLINNYPRKLKKEATMVCAFI